MFGFLVYLSTIPYFSHWVMALTFIYPLILRNNSFVRKIRENINYLYLYVLFVLLAMVNTFIYYILNYEIQFPYYFTILIAIIVGINLKVIDIKLIIYCIVFEAIIGIIELFLGVKTILPGITEKSVLVGSDLLYYKRVFGLSVGSSTYCLKLLIGLVLLHSFKSKIKYYNLYRIILIIAILLGFTRTVVLVAIIFEYSALFYENSLNRIKKILIISFTVILTIILLYCLKDYFIAQFSRGSNNIDLSGRPLIWSEFASFIQNNIICGNGSNKYLVPYYSGMIHAHNSFIQFIANHGIILFIYYLIIYISKISKKNIIYILPFFIYSMTQYGIWWGISLVDIIMFYYLLSYKREY